MSVFPVLNPVSGSTEIGVRRSRFLNWGTAFGLCSDFRRYWLQCSASPIVFDSTGRMGEAKVLIVGDGAGECEKHPSAADWGVMFDANNSFDDHAPRY